MELWINEWQFYSSLHLEPPESEFGSGGEARVASTKHRHLLLLAHLVLPALKVKAWFQLFGVNVV